MITHQDIKNLSIEWGLGEQVIEKDFVLGWVLWGICNHKNTKEKWVFKGGTCIKKCYIETYRFSEDLDFTVKTKESISEDQLPPTITEILSKVANESGIDFSIMEPKYKRSANGMYTQVRLYYRGPLNARNPGSIILDLSASEQIATTPIFKTISHPFKDELPGKKEIQSYSFEEIFAEKIRAMGERCRPRDLYDIINLFHNNIFDKPVLIKETLDKKCRSKGIPLVTLNTIINSEYKNELISEWKNMLAHQLPALPPFDEFWNELPELFKWLEGKSKPAKLKNIPHTHIKGVAQEDYNWQPSPTIQIWNRGIPLEKIRFAGMNHLCINLGYNGIKRLIEPYSIIRTQDGNYLLHAVKVQTGENRTYRIDRIQSIEVTDKIFRPRYNIELTSITTTTPSISSRSNKTSRRTSSRRRSVNYGGMTYRIQCPLCGKTFKRSKYDTKLNPHKDKHGMNCPGRVGYVV